MEAINQILSSDQKYSKAGSVSKSYGNRGEVLIKLFSDSLLQIFEDVENKKELISAIPPVFFLIDGIYTPFFIEKFTQKGKTGFVAKFSTVSDSSHSEELVGHEIFIHDTLVSRYMKKNGTGEREDEQTIDLQELIGYIVENEEGKEIGVISDVIEYPANVCFNITLSNASAKAQQSTIAREEQNATAKEKHASAKEKDLFEEILIPFHPDLLLSFDHKQRRIAMKIAKGLFQHH